MKKLTIKRTTSRMASIVMSLVLTSALIVPAYASDGETLEPQEQPTTVVEDTGTVSGADSSTFDAVAEVEKAEQAASDAVNALENAKEALDAAGNAYNDLENSGLENRIEETLEDAEAAEITVEDAAEDIGNLKDSLLDENNKLVYDDTKIDEFNDSAATVSDAVTDSKAAADEAVKIAGEAKDIAETAIDAAMKATNEAAAAKEAAQKAEDAYNKILQDSVNNGNENDIAVAQAENAMIEAQEAYDAAQKEADVKKQEAIAAQELYDNAVDEAKAVIIEEVKSAEKAYQDAIHNVADALADLVKAEAEYQEALKSGSENVQRAARARDRAKEAAASAVETAKEAQKIAIETAGKAKDIAGVAQDVIDKANSVISTAEKAAVDMNSVMSAVKEKEFLDNEQRNFLAKEAFAEDLILKLSAVIDSQADIDALLATIPAGSEWDVWRVYVNEMVTYLKENADFQKAMDAYRESELNRLTFLGEFLGISINAYASAEDAFQNDEQVRKLTLEKLGLSSDFTGTLEDAFQAHSDSVMMELLGKINVDIGKYADLQAAYDANLEAILEYFSGNAEEYAEYTAKVKAAQDAYNKAVGIAQRGERENLTLSGAVNDVIIVQQGSTYTSQLTAEFTKELANAILKEWQKTGYQGPEIVNGVDVSGLSLEEKAMAIASSTKAERASNGQYYEQNAGSWKQEASGAWVYEVKWGVSAGNTVNGQQVIAVDFNNINYNSKLPVSDSNPKYISYIFVLDGKYAANDTVYLEFTPEMLTALGWTGSGSKKSPNQVVTKRIVYQEDLNAITQEAMKDIVSISPAVTPMESPINTAVLPTPSPAAFNYNSNLSFSGSWNLDSLNWSFDDVVNNVDYSARISIPEVNPATQPTEEPEINPVTNPSEEPEINPVTNPTEEPKATPTTKQDNNNNSTGNNGNNGNNVGDRGRDTSDSNININIFEQNLTIIDDLPTPLAEFPESDLIEIFDEDVPLGALPFTGATNAMTYFWVFGLVASIASLAMIIKTILPGKNNSNDK